MPKPTGRPNGRPPKVKPDKPGIAFESLSKLNKSTGFVYTVNAIYDSGSRFFCGNIDTPSHDAVGSKFGSGTFELVKMKRATQEIVGEPIVLGIHPGVFEVKFPDPYGSARKIAGSPGAPFGFLPANSYPGAPLPVHPASGAEEVERRMKEELAKERERHEDELAALQDERDEERERKEQERVRDDERRARQEFETRILAMLEGKKSGGDELTRTIELVKALMPPMQAAPMPAQKTDWPAMITVGMTALSGLLNFGKQVAAVQTAHPVDTADLALQELLKLSAPLIQRFTGNGTAPAPAPAPSNGAHPQEAEMSEDQMMQAAFTELTGRLKGALEAREAPATVAAWYWEQRGLGWFAVHNYTRTLEPTKLVQAVVNYAPSLVDTPEKMAHLEFIAEAIKGVVPVG